jgi:hypothetical protein
MLHNRRDTVYFNRELQSDDIFVNTQKISLEALSGRPCRKGLTHAIISAGEIVNVVSARYGHLTNEQYFLQVEEQLINNDIDFIKRSINRSNRSFAVDYILNDESFHIHVKNGKDKLRPMLRFVNSYDGSCKTSGTFGFFREVCSNGLHVAHTGIGFSVKHKGNIQQLVIPEIKHTIKKFIDNEYYTLQRKFEVLAETPIYDLTDFVKSTAEHFNLFKYEASEKNPETPSANARLVMESIRREANAMDIIPNLWLGYNGFNEILHGKLKKPFGEQKKLDEQILNFALELAN